MPEPTGRWSIFCAANGRIYVWQGTYGWFQVRKDDPTAINRGHDYKTEAEANTALKRMKRTHPHNMTWRLAKVHDTFSLWVDKNDPQSLEVDWAKLEEQS